jgi:hypothetical protein
MLGFRIAAWPAASSQGETKDPMINDVSTGAGGCGDARCRVRHDAIPAKELGSQLRDLRY